MAGGKVFVEGERIRHESDSDTADNDEQPYSHVLWLPDIPNVDEYTNSTKCKGCRKQFTLTCNKGQCFKDSPSVQEFYRHCVYDCIKYEQLEKTTTCDKCMSLFMNLHNQQLHEEHCERIRNERGFAHIPVSSRPWKSSLSSGRSDSGESESSNSSDSQPKKVSKNKNDQTEKTDDEEKKRREIERLGKELADKMDCTQLKKKPGPRSRTSQALRTNDTVEKKKKSRSPSPSSSSKSSVSGSHSVVGNDGKTGHVGPRNKSGQFVKQSTASISQKENDPKPSTSQVSSPSVSKPCLSQVPSSNDGNSSNLMNSSLSSSFSSSPPNTPGRPRAGPASKTGRLPVSSTLYKPSAALNAPTAEMVKKVEEQQKLSGKDMNNLKKAISNNRRKSTPSDKKTPKKRKPRAYSPNSSSRKKKKTSNDDHSDSGEDSDFIPKYDSDGELVPECLHEVAPVTFEKKDYFVYIPRKAKSQSHFNSHIACQSCNETFPCATFSQVQLERASNPKPVYSEALYVHCLSKCEAYMKSGRMKECDNCFHRYLDDEEFKRHKKSKICKDMRKHAKLLRWKAPYMPRDQYYDMLELNLNAQMNCQACHKEFMAQRKGHDYTPGLELYCHMVCCPEYQELGTLVECKDCNFWYLSKKEYEKYDPCYKPPADEPRHGKPHYGKPDY